MSDFFDEKIFVMLVSGQLLYNL